MDNIPELRNGDDETCRPEQTQSVVELPPPRKKPSRPPKGSFRRTPRGQAVMRASAEWFIEKLEHRMRFAYPRDLNHWLSLGGYLKHLGINRASAIAELKPRIPDAHRWYSEHGEGKQFVTWEEYWKKSLFDRMYYFFRRHNADNRIEVAIAEWPGTVENGVLVAPEAPEQSPHESP